MTSPVALALTGGSVLSNSIAQGEIDHARAKAMAAQDARQSALDAQVNSANADALKQYTGFGDRQAGAQSTLAGLYNQGIVGTGTSTAPNMMPGPQSPLIANENAKQSGIKTAFAQQQAGAKATLDASSQALSDAGVARSQDLNQVSLYDHMKRQQAQVLPIALSAANAQGGGAKLLGDLLSGASWIAANVALQPKDPLQITPLAFRTEPSPYGSVIAPLPASSMPLFGQLY